MLKKDYCASYLEDVRNIKRILLMLLKGDLGPTLIVS